MSAPQWLRRWIMGNAKQYSKDATIPPGNFPQNFFQQALTPGDIADSSVVFAAISANAQTVAITEPEHRRRAKEGGTEVVTTSAAARIFRRPNDYETRTQLMLNTVHELLSTGNAYWVGDRNNREEVESVHLLKKNHTRPYVDPETNAVFYGCSNSPLFNLENAGFDFLIPARDVMHLRLYTPEHPLVGVTPIQYAAMAIESNNAITGNQAAFFRNMRRPSGILVSDQKFTAAQMRELRAAWDEQARGLNSGGVPILGGGLTWQSLGMNSQDAQLVEAYDMTVADIARAFRIPLPLIGDLRHSTFNNAETLLAFWLATGLGFLLEHIEASLARFFNLPPGQFINFDTNKLLRTDFAGRVDALTKGITGGLYSPNEARDREGLPPVADGWEPRLQAQVVPLSAAGKIEPAPAAPAAPAAGDQEGEEGEETDKAAPLSEAAAMALFERGLRGEH